MIIEDLNTIKEIFALLDSGVVDGYDSFTFEVEVGAGYINTVLKVEKDGITSTDVKTDINYAILYALVKNLRENAVQRGEGWTSFVLSYKLGGQVKTNFKYNK
ncbi:hypothetical protein ACM9XD_06225 [Xanthomonas sacchari]